MLLPLYAMEMEYKQRLDDAERRRAHLALIRDATEQAPHVVFESLRHQIMRRMHIQRSQKQQQGTRDARRATAV